MVTDLHRIPEQLPGEPSRQQSASGSSASCCVADNCARSSSRRPSSSSAPCAAAARSSAATSRRTRTSSRRPCCSRYCPSCGCGSWSPHARTRVPARAPGAHPQRQRTHYMVDRSLAQLGVDEGAPAHRHIQVHPAAVPQRARRFRGNVCPGLGDDGLDVAHPQRRLRHFGKRFAIGAEEQQLAVVAPLQRGQTRVAHQPTRGFGGDGSTVFDMAAIAVSLLRQHRAVHVHHDLVALGLA